MSEFIKVNIQDFFMTHHLVFITELKKKIFHGFNDHLKTMFYNRTEITFV